MELLKRKISDVTEKYKLYFTIYSLIKEGLSPVQICDKLNRKIQNLNYYISTLKRAKLIEKLGYSVWKVSKEYDEVQIKQVQKSIKGDNCEIRGHAFQLTIQIPKLRNWNKREEYLKKKKINYKPLNILGGGQRIFFLGRKIWLTNKSVIIYETKSFYADSAKKSKNYAIDSCISLIHSLEGLLNTSFKINSKYLFKVDKAHYARIKCDMAKHYRKDGKKLYVSDHRGFWLWADYSFTIDETETGNQKESDKDMDEHIHPFLNSLKKIEGYTPEWVTNMLGELIRDRAEFAAHHRSHTKAVQTLASQVGILGKQVKRFKDRLNQKKLKEFF